MILYSPSSNGEQGSKEVPANLSKSPEENTEENASMPSLQTTASSPRELIHAVNNFLSLVVCAGEVALDESSPLEPERALESILAGADDLTALVRASRAELASRS